jgi:hypothetical protein
MIARDVICWTVADPDTEKLAVDVTTLLSVLFVAIAVMAVDPGPVALTRPGVDAQLATGVLVPGFEGVQTVATCGLLEYQVTV